MDLTETTVVETAGGTSVQLLGERMSLRVVQADRESARDALVADVRRGLGAPRKWLPPRWFYDDAGCALFEQITELPEYYQTRTEAAILDAASPRIAALARAATLVELGAGSCTKTRILLRAMVEEGCTQFTPVDVSEAALAAAAPRLVDEFPLLHVHGVVADFTAALDALAPHPQRCIAFLGSTIGNLLPHDRVELYRHVRAALDGSGSFLLGVDMVKPHAELHAAYNDAAGITAAFNLNVLRVLDRELGADFDVAAFEHEAPYLPELARVEMHLRSRRDQWVEVPAAAMRVHFTAGETLLTEISCKFTRARVEAELGQAGLRVVEWFSDDAQRFGLCLAVPA